MPQIQMLPAVPSFGSELGRVLGAGLGEGIQGSISNYVEKKQSEREGSLVADALKDLRPDADPFEIAATITRLPIRDKSKKLYGTIAALSQSASRERRLQSQNVHDQYRKAINDINAEIKNTFEPNELKKLNSKRDRLKKELVLNHKLMREGKSPQFNAYEALGDEDGEALNEMPEQELGGLEGIGDAVKDFTPKSPEIRALLPKKNPKRPLTEAVVRHFMKKAKGDLTKAKEMALKEGFQ